METCKITHAQGVFSDSFGFVAKDYSTDSYAMDPAELTRFVCNQVVNNGGFRLADGRVGLKVFLHSPSLGCHMMWLIINDAFRPVPFRMELTIDPVEAQVVTAAEFFLDWAKPYWDENTERWDALQDNDRILNQLQLDLLCSKLTPWTRLLAVNLPVLIYDQETGDDLEMDERQIIFADGSVAFLTPDDGPIGENEQLYGKEDEVIEGEWPLVQEDEPNGEEVAEPLAPNSQSFVGKLH